MTDSEHGKLRTLEFLYDGVCQHAENLEAELKKERHKMPGWAWLLIGILGTGTVCAGAFYWFLSQLWNR